MLKGGSWGGTVLLGDGGLERLEGGNERDCGRRRGGEEMLTTFKPEPKKGYSLETTFQENSVGFAAW